MSGLKTLCAGAALLSLCGCQSLTVMALKSLDQKPYSLPVAAEQLDTIPAEAEEVALAAADPAPADASTADVSTADLTVLAFAEPETEPEPERTDIRGQGDGAMTDERVVVFARKDIAHRAPNYSREQVAAMLCLRRIDGSASRLKAAQRAYDATLAAHEINAAFLAGQRTAKEADDAERKRQDAIRGMTGSNMFFNLFGGRAKKEDLPKPESEGLVIEDADLYTFTENGRSVMAVSGVVRNTTDKQAELPPLTLAAIDQWEFILAGQTSLLPFEALEPGEAKPFELRFHNPPDTTYEVHVHFAPPFEYRMRRECDLSDLASEPMTAPRSAEAAAAVASPMHTAAELNVLTRVYRSEAEGAWSLRSCGKPEPAPPANENRSNRRFQVGPGGGGERRSLNLSINLGRFNTEGLCAAWARRLPWRESFALAEATDEAWGAMLAAGEMKRRHAAGLASQEEVDDSEAAQQRAYAAFRSLGGRTLARAGGKVDGVEIDIANSTFGYDQISKAFDGADISQVGFYVDVSGQIRNTSDAGRQVDALMLALVDRLEQPLLTFRLDDEIALAPGETRTFQHRVYFSDPVRRENQKDTPAWQVRIGAVGG